MNPAVDSSFWKNLTQDPTSCVKLVEHKMHLSFPPYYLENLKHSVQAVIDQKLNRYVEDLGGILAGHGTMSILKPNGDIFFNLCDIHVDVQGDFYVFNPTVGSQLTGIVNKKNAGHIGCLVHGLFNISLPKPFSLPNQSWLGTTANIHDKIKFTVTQLDFQSQVPFIQGNIEEVCHMHVEIPITQEVKMEEQTPSMEETLAVDAAEGEVPKKAESSKKKNKKNKQPVAEAVPTAETIPVAETVPVAEPTVKESRKRKRTATENPIEETPMKKKSKQSSQNASTPFVVNSGAEQLLKKNKLRGKLSDQSPFNKKNQPSDESDVTVNEYLGEAGVSEKKKKKKKEKNTSEQPVQVAESSHNDTENVLDSSTNSSSHFVIEKYLHANYSKAMAECSDSAVKTPSQPAKGKTDKRHTFVIERLDGTTPKTTPKSSKKPIENGQIIETPKNSAKLSAKKAKKSASKANGVSEIDDSEFLISQILNDVTGNSPKKTPVTHSNKKKKDKVATDSEKKKQSNNKNLDEMTPKKKIKLDKGESDEELRRIILQQVQPSGGKSKRLSKKKSL